MGGFEPIGGPGGAIVDDSEPVGDPGRIWFDTSPSDGVEMKLADESGWTLIGKIPDDQVTSFDYSDAGFGQLDKFDPLGELTQEAFVDSSSPEHDPGRIWFDSSSNGGVDVNVADDTGWTLVGQLPYVSETAPSAEFSASPTDPTTGDDVSFSVSNYENVASYTINYDDGNKSEDQTDISSISDHSYSNTGDYTPELIVANDAGMTVSYTVSIEVADPEPEFGSLSRTEVDEGPYYVEINDAFKVNATFENTGGEADATVALLDSDDSTVDSTTKTVSSGETVTVSIIYSADTTGTHTYRVAVGTENEWHAESSSFDVEYENLPSPS